MLIVMIVMCRAGVLRIVDPLETFVSRPTNSLIHQSSAAAMGATALNADGFGVGWYSEGDPVPALFRSVQPAWADANLGELARHIRSPLFLAHVRATTGTPVQQTNCHPFRCGHWLWAHNGGIREFATVRRDLLLAVDPELFPGIAGSTDSEVNVLSRTHVRPGAGPRLRGRANGRVRRGRRKGSRGAVADPDDGRHHRREAAVGIPLLQRGPVAHPVLHRSRVHGAPAASGRAAVATAVRGDPAGRLRTLVRPSRRLDRGSRVLLGIVQPGQDVLEAFHPQQP